ncbi:ROK family protein [Propionibacterium sp. NM47_B9-13]|uniref:Transcriptional regulator n=2 Tax=Cutibacterium modestum TaxID=2559073 RepID=A0AAD1NW12_9ACTN|nr:ROK family transcriptional regulator [Cutibacterium modestum]MCP2376328.1 ROK family protein [Cutibacterium modestum 28N]MCP2381104.1 ROK family protein [Cutibacterium modestum 30N]TGY29394.1 ROK family protein [Propionibacterium sp. NM47_B9-13]AOH44834.1 hypothetical protein BCB70_01735 [Cutibacterium modestum]EFS74862.1 ROK family protein [Cutibacterium modestum HL037PA2]
MFDGSGSEGVVSGRNLADLREHNRQTVLRCLIESTAPLTIRELARLTGITRPTVASALSDLVETGDALEGQADHASGRGGRRPHVFTLNATKRMQAGVAVRLQGVELAIADWQGTILASDSRPLRGRPPAEILDNLLDDLLVATGITSVDTMVIGAIGSVGRDGVLRRNETLPDISAPGYFERLHDARVGRIVIENDAVLAAVAEQRVRNLPTDRSMVCLLIDASVGVGIVLDGHPVRGAAGYAGEMSYLPGSGWNDAHVALMEQAQAHGCTAQRLFKLAGESDPPAWSRLVLRNFIDDVTFGLTALMAALNPDLLVIGGYACAAHEPIRQRLTDNFTGVLPHLPVIEPASAGTSAVVHGAISLALSSSTEPSLATSNHSA